MLLIAFNNKAKVVQRMGHGSDWEDSSSIIKRTQLHPSCYRLFHLVGRGSTIEESRTE